MVGSTQTQNITWHAGNRPRQGAASLLFLYLIKEDLTDIRGEMAQGSKSFAEDFQEAVLDRKQRFLFRCL